jgi:hypothetical protein
MVGGYRVEQGAWHKCYPFDDLSSGAAQGWLGELRGGLEDEGSCLLVDFVTPRALERMASEASSIAHLAFPGPTEVSPYFFDYRLGQGRLLPEDHPLRRKGRRKLAQVAADLIPRDFLLARLYRDPDMLEFLSALVGQPVYRNRDPYQSLNISVMNEGGCQQWHFDSGNLVTTLLLQAPEGGGIFEYAPAIRSDEDENFAAVQAVLDGDRGRVRQNRLRPGTLSLFRGHYSLHRVTEVTGSRQRLQAILGYATKPDLYGSRESSILHYGPRVAEIEASNPRYPARVAN